MFQCLNEGRARPDNNMTIANLNFLSRMVDQNLKDIDKRMETLKVNEMTQNIQPQMQTPALNYALGSDMNTAEPMQNLWFMDFLNNGDGDERLIMPAFGDANNSTPNWLLVKPVALKKRDVLVTSPLGDHVSVEFSFAWFGYFYCPCVSM